MVLCLYRILYFCPTMFWLLFITGMCIPCWSAQATSCTEDSHCPVDYYCELGTYSCRQCLRCEDYKRVTPPGTPCVKSVVECGNCLELKSDGSKYGCEQKTNSNKLADSESEEIRVPVYAWVLLVLIVMVIVGGAVFISVINKAAYAAVSRSESQITGTNGHCESAWSSPPAYNAVFNIPQDVEEGPAPYVKPSAPSNDIRESAVRQATRPFDPPNYIRGPQLSDIPTPDRFSINDDTGMENSVDGVISLQTPVTDVVVLPAGTVSNIAMEECPNEISSRTYEPVEAEVGDAAERTRGATPVVVVNNLHVQAVAVTGASIFIPEPIGQSW